MLLVSFDECVAAGKSLDNFSSDMLNCYREMLKFSVIGGEYRTSAKRYKLIQEIVGLYTQEKIIRCIYLLTDLVHDLKFVSNPRVLIECTLIKMANPAFESGEAALLDRIAALEKKLASGSFVQQVAQPEEAKPKTTPEEDFAMYGEAPPEEYDYDIPPVYGGASEAVVPSQTQENDSNMVSSPASVNPDVVGVVNNWSDIISAVMDAKQLNLYFHISMAVPRAGEDALVLLFDDNANKNSFDKTDEKSKLCDIIREVTGKSVVIKCMLKDESASSVQSDASADDIFANLAAHSNEFPDNIKFE